METKKPQHKHLMLRGFIIDPPKDTDEVVEWLKGFIEFLGMNVLQGPFSSYVDKVGNAGLTAVAMIETSHIAFHIWDEKNPALIQFDTYTCGDLDTAQCLRELERYFNFYSYDYIVYDRENKFQIIGMGRYGSEGL